MDFAVAIINLVKQLKSRHETVIQIKSAEAVHLSELIFVKHNMLTEKRTSLQSFKLL